MIRWNNNYQMMMSFLLYSHEQMMKCNRFTRIFWDCLRRFSGFYPSIRWWRHSLVTMLIDSRVPLTFRCCLIWLNLIRFHGLHEDVHLKLRWSIDEFHVEFVLDWSIKLLITFLWINTAIKWLVSSWIVMSVYVLGLLVDQILLNGRVTW